MRLNLQKIENTMLSAALEVLKILSNYGEALIVGGGPRDLILGNKPKDFDISTNVPMNTICRLFNSFDIGKNKEFGIVVVKHGNYIFEIANFRADSTYSDNRHPDSIEFVKTFKEDTARRDFTINILGMDLEGNVIDYHNGLSDLNNKILRTVGNAQDRFKEDALRILRAIRFAVRFDLTIDESAVKAIEALKWSLKNISAERIKDELSKMVSYGSRKFSAALELMDKLGLTEVIFESIKKWNLKGLNSLKEFNHYDFVTCLSIMFQTQLDSFESDYSINDIMDNLKFTNEEKKEITFILSNIAAYNNISSISKKDALRIVSNGAFSKLRFVYVAITGTDFSEKTITEIAEYDIINEKRKVVNQVILTEHIIGRNFGMISEMVVDWMFAVMESGKQLPNDKDIENFTRLTCLTCKK